jgi:hypothetical protein
MPHRGLAIGSRFDVDTQRAGECARVARLYAARPEIFTRLSWDCLVHLAAPSLSAEARRGFEARILGGERIVAH